MSKIVLDFSSFPKGKNIELGENPTIFGTDDGFCDINLKSLFSNEDSAPLQECDFVISCTHKTWFFQNIHSKTRASIKDDAGKLVAHCNTEQLYELKTGFVVILDGIGFFRVLTLH